MGKETGYNSRLAGYIDLKIGNAIREWPRSIKPNNHERALMVNTVLDLYHAKSIEELTGFTREIEANKKRINLPFGIKVETLTEKVAESYEKKQREEENKKPSERRPTQAIIHDLIITHRIANPLGVARLSFSLQMTTFGNYTEKILGELIHSKMRGKKIETHIAHPKYL